MQFLAPLFLAALAALAVPLLVHLTHRQRRDPVAFPSLMFLRRIEFKSTRRQHVRHPLLLALRALALLLLALAFARPFLGGRDASAAGLGGGREVVILVDDSFSMGYGDRWTRARAAVTRAIEGIGPADRASLVRFSATASALGPPTSDRGTLRAAIEGLQPGPAAGRYAPALSLARNLLARAERPRREVILVSDLQRAGWVPGEELRLPAGSRLTVVDVGTDSTANVAVGGVELARTVSGERERVTATVRVTNRSPTAATGVPVTLVLEGREVARRTVDLPANGAASVRLDPVALPGAVTRGELRAGTDALPGDNVRHLVLDRDRTLGVLVLQEAGVPASRTLYLRRALEIGRDPAMRVDVARLDQLTAARLAGRSVVILDDVRAPGDAAARLLAAFAREGGGVLVTLGERARAGDWGGEAAALLPGTIGPVVDRTADRGGRLGALDRSHPALAPFVEARSGNFSAPRFFRYRSLAPRDSTAVIARWDDGGVALAERALGRGRVLAWGSTFDNVWNDLPVQPVFLPLVRQLVQHAGGWRDEPAWRTVGDALDASTLVDRGADTTGIEWAALSPAGDATRLDAATPVLRLDAPGIWEVRRFGARGAPARIIAVNVDAGESDLARVPQAEVTATLAPRGTAGAADSAAASSLTLEEREAEQGIWWWLLVLAALALAADTLLSNQLSRVRAPVAVT